MFRRFSFFVKRHLIVIFIVLASLIATTVFLFAYNNYQIGVIRDTIAQSDARLAELDATIARVQAEKAAKAAAELLAKQEADAKAAADQAKTATASTAATIDSTTCNTATTHNDPASVDVLVNKKHCIQPVSFAPADLTYIRGTSFQLSAKAAPSVEAMMNAAAAAGQALAVTSSYRSYATQVTTYNYWVSISGKDGADTYSARPGYSEHQTGLALDVQTADGRSLSNFAGTSQYQWLQAHAHEYGFIQRYIAGYESVTGYSAEEWHYRYVGVDVATDMRTKGIKTLEQYWSMSGGDY